MWTAILGVAAAALGFMTKLWGGGDSNAKDEQQLGAATTENAELTKGAAAVKAANLAAKAVDPGREAIDADVNNLDR
jgi:hypothetical protein